MKTYTIRLYMPGNETPVEIYNGVTEFHTKDDGRQLVFTRSNGQEMFTNLQWVAEK